MAAPVEALACPAAQQLPPHQQHAAAAANRHHPGTDLDFVAQLLAAPPGAATPASISRSAPQAGTSGQQRHSRDRRQARELAQRWRGDGAGVGVSARRACSGDGRQSAAGARGASQVTGSGRAGSCTAGDTTRSLSVGRTRSKRSHGHSSSSQVDQPSGSGSSSSSSSAARKCETCGCWVPGGSAGWAVHCEGIRHRRQCLSLDLHGEPGHLVVSTFESVPAPGEPMHRLVGKTTAGFRALNTASPAQDVTSRTHWGDKLATATSPAMAANLQQEIAETHYQAGPLWPELEAMVAAARKELLNHCGVSDSWRRYADQISSRPRRLLVEHDEAAVHCRASAILQQGCSYDAAEHSEASPGLQLLFFPMLIRRYHITFLTYSLGEEITPLITTGLCLLARSLTGNKVLQTLTISFYAASTWDLFEKNYSAALREVVRCASAFLRELRKSLEQNTVLRSVTLIMPPLRGAEELQQQAAQLQQDLRAALASRRQAVLAGTHPRAEGSLLRMLPAELMRRILELGVPLQPCTIVYHEKDPTD